MCVRWMNIIANKVFSLWVIRVIIFSIGRIAVFESRLLTLSREKFIVVFPPYHRTKFRRMHENTATASSYCTPLDENFVNMKLLNDRNFGQLSQLIRRRKIVRGRHCVMGVCVTVPEFCFGLQTA